MDSALRQKTLGGVFWSFIQRASTQLVAFVVTVIMARMLTPADYGLVAMLVLFVELGVTISEGGMSQALIQARRFDSPYVSAALVYNVSISLALYGLVWVYAPLIASFYEIESLCPLVRALALNIPIKSLASVRLARLTSKMEFRALAFIDIVSTMAAGVIGIWMAATGYGVWAIIVWQVALAALSTVMLWIFGEKPERIRLNKVAFKRLFSFGSRILTAGIIEVIYRNMYLPIIGKVYNPNQLGFFTRARQFASLPPISIGEVSRNVTYPLFCNLGESPQERYGSFLRIERVIWFVVIPVMLFVAIFAEPIVGALLGEKWMESALLLPIMSIGMMLNPIDTLNVQMIQACGCSDYFLHAEIWKKGVGLALLFSTVWLGIEWVAIGWGVSAFASAMISAIYCSKVCRRDIPGASLAVQFHPTIKILLVSIGVVMFGKALSMTCSEAWVQLGVGLGASVLLYVGVAYLLDMRELQGLIRIFKKR